MGTSRFQDMTGHEIESPTKIVGPPAKEGGKPLRFYLRDRRISLKLRSMKLMQGVTWEKEYMKAEYSPDPRAGHTASDWLVGEAIAEDNITLFRVPSGAVEEWRNRPIEVYIDPLPEGYERPLGNRNERYIFTASDDHPDEPPLDEEPGSLVFSDKTKGRHGMFSDLEEAAALSLYVDRGAFEKLADRLALVQGRQVEITLTARIEVFQHEIDAFFDDGTSGRDFGVLVKGDDGIATATRARLENLTFGTLLLAPPPEGEPVEDWLNKAPSAEGALVAEIGALRRSIRFWGGLVLVAMVLVAFYG